MSDETGAVPQFEDGSPSPVQPGSRAGQVQELEDLGYEIAGRLLAGERGAALRSLSDYVRRTSSMLRETCKERERWVTRGKALEAGREKAEFSARQFCGAHVGKQFETCPACEAENLRSGVLDLHRGITAQARIELRRLRSDATVEYVLSNGAHHLAIPIEKVDEALQNLDRHGFRGLVTDRIRFLEAENNGLKLIARNAEELASSLLAELKKCRGGDAADTVMESKG